MHPSTYLGALSKRDIPIVAIVSESARSGANTHLRFELLPRCFIAKTFINFVNSPVIYRMNVSIGFFLGTIIRI